MGAYKMNLGDWTHHATGPTSLSNIFFSAWYVEMGLQVKKKEDKTDVKKISSPNTIPKLI